MKTDGKWLEGIHEHADVVRERQAKAERERYAPLGEAIRLLVQEWTGLAVDPADVRYTPLPVVEIDGIEFRPISADLSNPDSRGLVVMNVGAMYCHTATDKDSLAVALSETLKEREPAN